MIQSVVNTRQDAKTDTLDCCQAPTSFFASAKQEKSGLFNENAKQLTEAVRLTQEFLNTLDKSGKKDDSRRFDQFTEAWRKTIVEELLAIHKAVGERAGTFTESSQKFGKLAAATEQSDKEPRTKNGIYAIPADAHQSSGMQVYDLPKEAFGALETQHSEIRANLLEFQKKLDQLARDTAGVLGPIVVNTDDGRFENTYPATENKGSAVEPEAAGKPNSIGDLIGLDQLDEGVGKDILEHIAKLSVIPISAQKDDKRYENFKNYITKKNEPDVHAERLSKLTTALNILYMRKIGLKAAAGTSDKLYGDVGKKAGEQAVEVEKILGQISTQLGALKDVAKKAFRGAQELGVVIQESLLPSENVPPLQEHLDTHMTELAKYIGNDGNGEFLPQLTLVTNVLWRLHAIQPGSLPNTVRWKNL